MSRTSTLKLKLIKEGKDEEKAPDWVEGENAASETGKWKEQFLWSIVEIIIKKSYKPVFQNSLKQ